MTLGTMRRHGVRGLFVTCEHCGHERAVNMNDWPDDAAVPSFGPLMRCSSCGKLGATAAQLIEQADRLPGGTGDDVIVWPVLARVAATGYWRAATAPSARGGEGLYGRIRVAYILWS
jgi:hypothetical protein